MKESRRERGDLTDVFASMLTLSIDKGGEDGKLRDKKSHRGSEYLKTGEKRGKRAGKEITRGLVRAGSYSSQ